MLRVIFVVGVALCFYDWREMNASRPAELLSYRSVAPEEQEFYVATNNECGCLDKADCFHNPDPWCRTPCPTAYKTGYPTAQSCKFTYLENTAYFCASSTPMVWDCYVSTDEEDLVDCIHVQYFPETNCGGTGQGHRYYKSSTDCCEVQNQYEEEVCYG